jgi:hypothetical protein
MTLPTGVSDRHAQSFRDAGDNATKVAVTDESTIYFVAVDEVNKNLSYIGKSVIGSSQAGAVWQISRLQTTGTVTLLQYADGDNSFDNIWNNRASLTYS